MIIILITTTITITITLTTTTITTTITTITIIIILMTCAITGEIRETTFLFQRKSITIQRFNAVAFSGTFACQDKDEHGISDIKFAAAYKAITLEDSIQLK